MKCGDCAYLRYNSRGLWCHLSQQEWLRRVPLSDEILARECIRNDERVAELRRQLADGKDCSTCKWTPGDMCGSCRKCSKELYDYWEPKGERPHKRKAFCIPVEGSDDAV